MSGLRAGPRATGVTGGLGDLEFDHHGIFRVGVRLCGGVRAYSLVETAYDVFFFLLILGELVIQQVLSLVDVRGDDQQALRRVLGGLQQAHAILQAA